MDSRLMEQNESRRLIDTTHSQFFTGAKSINISIEGKHNLFQQIVLEQLDIHMPKINK